MTEKNPNSDKYPSKSQRKRDRGELLALAAKLTELNKEHINKIDDSSVKESVEATRKIHKGSARKRQLQYTAKLLSKVDTAQVRQLIDTIDASTSVYVEKFHSLENWRESLIQKDTTVLEEILLKHPNCDRQMLRQLVRNAIKERENDTQGPHFRKLFQFLKQLS